MKKLRREVENVLNKYNLKDIRLIIELGRYLVAKSGIFLTQIVDMKDGLVLTDGGINHFLRPVFMDLNHPTLIVNKLGKEETRKVNIGGPLCTPIDIIAKNIDIPDVSIGDIVGVFNAGAYGYNMSILEFLGHKKPAEVLLKDEQAYLIREPGSFKDLLYKQVVPSILI